MEFHTHNFGKTVGTALMNAASCTIAVAYFNPDDRTLHALSQVPDVKVIVSDEFQVIDPYKLETLRHGNNIRFVSTETNQGLFHPKVILVKYRGGGIWGMVGSANITWRGLFSNVEACVLFDSSSADDGVQLRRIDTWLAGTYRRAAKFPFLLAKQIFENRHKVYSRFALKRPQGSTDRPLRFCALKTTSGSEGCSHWYDFLREGVIAIGWPDLGVNPAIVSKETLTNAIRRSYKTEHKGIRAAKRVATKIRSFVDLRPNDLVLICRGYPGHSNKDVHIFGLARVVAPAFFYDKSSSWWKFKHHSVIQVIDAEIPRKLVAAALNQGSLRGAINELDPRRLTSIAKLIRDYADIIIDV